ncbi:hypothetical protein AB9P05_10595 [Roseivirga sp. BDSF3-8]|uniref:hypothetical protein n=1 Tax=Roseivirga sp. BDSF3-8 TaxID=3241598 RepID=UPI0035326776
MKKKSSLKPLEVASFVTAVPVASKDQLKVKGGATWSPAGVCSVGPDICFHVH